MKRITLLRHAKSAWDNPSLSDFERPLNERGEHDAPEMGKRLLQRGVRPTLVLSSDAVRALATARIISRAISFPLGFIQPVHDLYLASPTMIAAVLEREAEQYSDVLLVGHNPGLTDIVNHISDARVDNVPTCGIFTIDIAIENWRDLLRTKGTLTWYDYPKKAAEN